MNAGFQLVATMPDNVKAMRSEGDALIVTLDDGRVVVLTAADLLDFTPPKTNPC